MKRLDQNLKDVFIIKTDKKYETNKKYEKLTKEELDEINSWNI